jgi:hypothetical protein
MATIGYKQKGTNGPLYNPERDYAYITPSLMIRAIENLDTAAVSPQMQVWYEKNNISQDEIVAISGALAAAQKDFVNGADPVKSFEEALSRHNFFSFRLPVRQVLFAAIGEVFCAAWFLAVREVSILGAASPAQNDMARFASTVCEFAARHGARQYNADFLAEHLRMSNDVLMTRLKMAHQEIMQLRASLQDANNTIKQQAAPLPLWRRIIAVFVPTSRC